MSLNEELEWRHQQKHQRHQRRHHYNVRNWYWIVDGSTTQVYSSARAVYVPVADAVYGEWLAAGHKPTCIISEAELQEVLAVQFPAGWPVEHIKDQARAALAASNDAVLEQLEKLALPPVWRDYRAALRAIASGEATATTLPSPPPQIASTTTGIVRHEAA